MVQELADQSRNVAESGMTDQDALSESAPIGPTEAAGLRRGGVMV